MKVYVINGANLNMLGIREPDIYGSTSYKALTEMIEKKAEALGMEAVLYQSNHEGDLVDKIQEAYFEKADGIIINPGAYTHTGIALYDALKAVGLPAVEVHISDPDTREEYRRISYIRPACEKTICGKGLQGYIEALEYLAERG